MPLDWKESAWCLLRHQLLSKQRTEDAAGRIAGDWGDPDRDLKLAASNLRGAVEHGVEVISKSEREEDRAVVSSIVGDLARLAHDIEVARTAARAHAMTPEQRELLLTAPVKIDAVIEKTSALAREMDPKVECVRCKSDLLVAAFAVQEGG